MKTRVLNTGVYMLDLVEKFTCEFVRTEVHTCPFSTIPNQEKKKSMYDGGKTCTANLNPGNLQK